MTQSDMKVVEKVVKLYFEGKSVKEAIRQVISEGMEGEHE